MLRIVAVCATAQAQSFCEAHSPRIVRSVRSKIPDREITIGGANNDNISPLPECDLILVITALGKKPEDAEKIANTIRWSLVAFCPLLRTNTFRWALVLKYNLTEKDQITILHQPSCVD